MLGCIEVHHWNQQILRCNRAVVFLPFLPDIVQERHADVADSRHHAIDDDVRPGIDLRPIPLQLPLEGKDRLPEKPDVEGIPRQVQQPVDGLLDVLQLDALQYRDQLGNGYQLNDLRLRHRAPLQPLELPDALDQLLPVLLIKKRTDVDFDQIVRQDVKEPSGITIGGLRFETGDHRLQFDLVHGFQSRAQFRREAVEQRQSLQQRRFADGVDVHLRQLPRGDGQPFPVAHVFEHHFQCGGHCGQLPNRGPHEA
mmetsp:Transcript_64435/g.106671  ORF Transcript_64435/g.106671 Transcript_64435/m.106671 type:complete len:254 (+) Transcript_64435:1539-2300(+)